MKGSRFTEEQIIGVLPEQEAGASMPLCLAVRIHHMIYRSTANVMTNAPIELSIPRSIAPATRTSDVIVQCGTCSSRTGSCIVGLGAE